MSILLDKYLTVLMLISCTSVFFAVIRFELNYRYVPINILNWSFKHFDIATYTI